MVHSDEGAGTSNPCRGMASFAVGTVRERASERHAIKPHIWQGINPSNRCKLYHYTDDVTRMLGFNPSNRRESQQHGGAANFC
jgi:hypothetical protein